VSHIEYAPRALLTVEKNATERLTDGRLNDALRLALNAASKIIGKKAV